MKKIHYCWFGGEKPDSVKRNVEHWAKLNPDFEICEWNENNIDVSKYDYALRALESGQWAFLSDIVRLEVLIRYGGVYMDTDVELIRPFADVLEYGDVNKLIMGYMYDCALGTAVLYAPENHPYLKDILHSYKYISPKNWVVNNTVFTVYFINRVEEFYLKGKLWENSLSCIYPKEFFEQPAFIRKRGMSIHHCCGSWKSVFKKDFSIVPRLNWLSHVMKWGARKRRTWLAARHNEFTDCYRAALKGEKMVYDISHLYTVDNPYSEE